MGRLPVAVALAVAIAGAPGAAQAAAVAQLQVDVDGDGRPDALTVSDDGKLEVVATRMPASSAPLGVDGWRITRASIEHKDYAGRHVLLVRVSEVEGSESAVLLEIDRSRTFVVKLWQGAIGVQGRDGEWSIQMALGDQMPLLFATKDGVARCDGPPAQIDRRGFDFGAKEWRPLGYASALPRPAGAVELHAVRGAAPAGLTASTRPMVFRATAASSSEQDGGSAEDLTTPTEIDDGKLDSAWVEGRVSDGRGEFVTLRSRARAYKVVALRVVPGDAASADAFARSNRLARVHVVTDAGAAYVVSFDADPAFGDAYWITLPQPVAARCVSLVLDDVWPARAGRARAHRTAIAELAVFTELEAGGAGALDSLAETVATGEASEAQAAEDLLAERGAPAATALVAAAQKPGRKPGERRRIRLALARVGDAVGAAEVAAGLAEALAPVTAAGANAGADAAADHVRERDAERLALGLERMGAGATVALAALLADDKAPIVARVIAAERLGAIAEPAARAALEAACGHGRRMLRQAVTAALGKRAAGELPAALDAATAAAAANDRAREADLWRVVALLAPRAALPAAAAVRERLAGAAAARLAASTDYELRHRLIEALAAVAEQPAARSALAEVLRMDAEPALRLAVVTGLARPEHVHDAWAGETLLAASTDGDPGVRAAAVTGLGTRGEADGAAEPALVVRLGIDPWPEVRRAAAGALAERCGRAPVADAFFTAVDHDTSDPVRRVALGALVRCKDPRAGEKLLSIVADAQAAPAWRQFAAVQLGALADRALVPRILELFARTRKDAFDHEASMWVAAGLARALGALADPRADAALAEAAADPTFWPVQAAAVEALARTCPATARRAARAALSAENGRVVGAARRTIRQCGW